MLYTPYLIMVTIPFIGGWIFSIVQLNNKIIRIHRKSPPFQIFSVPWLSTSSGTTVNQAAQPVIYLNYPIRINIMEIGFSSVLVNIVYFPGIIGKIIIWSKSCRYSQTGAIQCLQFKRSLRLYSPECRLHLLHIHFPLHHSISNPIHQDNPVQSNWKTGDPPVTRMARAPFCQSGQKGETVLASSIDNFRGAGSLI